MLDFFIFVFGFVLLISIYNGIQTKIFGKNYSDFFGYTMFEVQTGSMADTINAGDWVLVEITKKAKGQKRSENFCKVALSAGSENRWK